MYHLPEEILHQILRNACIDDGKTGCVLSSVSHFIRSVSAPVRYHSVALRGAWQICSFIRLLDAYAPRGTSSQIHIEEGETEQDVQQKFRSPMQELSHPIIDVKHLFVADDRVERPSWQIPAIDEWLVDPDTNFKLFSARVRAVEATHSHRRSTSRMSTRESHDAADALVDDADTKADTTIRNLLVRLAPSLTHLCITQGRKSSVLYLPVPLLALVELSYHPTHPRQGAVFLRTQFPVLERLHFALSHRAKLENVVDLPPSLSLVRFSDMLIPYGLRSIFANHETSPWAIQEPLKIFVSRDPQFIDGPRTGSQSSAQLSDYNYDYDYDQHDDYYNHDEGQEIDHEEEQTHDRDSDDDQHSKEETDSDLDHNHDGDQELRDQAQAHSRDSDQGSDHDNDHVRHEDRHHEHIRHKDYDDDHIRHEDHDHDYADDQDLYHHDHEQEYEYHSEHDPGYLREDEDIYNYDLEHDPDYQQNDDHDDDLDPEPEPEHPRDHEEEEYDLDQFSEHSASYYQPTDSNSDDNSLLSIGRPNSIGSVEEAGWWQEIARGPANIVDKIFVVKDRHHDMDSAERLFAEWLDRVQGGEGCWVEGRSVCEIATRADGDYRDVILSG
jgi:hypothetical protein